VALGIRSRAIGRRSFQVLILALAPACAHGSRPTLLPRGSSAPAVSNLHRTSTSVPSLTRDPQAGAAGVGDTHQASARIQLANGRRYEITLSYDLTPTYAATSGQSSCEDRALSGTENHQLDLEIRSLDAHARLPLPDLEIHLSAPRTVALSRVTTLWADPAGCLVGTSTSRRLIPPHGSVMVRGSVSRLPIDLAPGSVRVFLSQWGVGATNAAGGPELDENGFRVYRDEVVTLRVP